MKALLIGLLLLGSVSTFAATTLFCSAVTYDRAFDLNYHAFIKGKMELDCASIKYDKDADTGLSPKNKFKVTISNTGIGFFGASQEGLTIICPTVRAKALGLDSFINKNGMTKKGITELYGVRASAGFIVGADAAVFASKGGGFCALVGVNGVSMGALAAGAKMTVELVD